MLMTLTEFPFLTKKQNKTAIKVGSKMMTSGERTVHGERIHAVFTEGRVKSCISLVTGKSSTD